MKSVYTAVATAEGGRDGRARSLDGRMDLEIKPPTSLGGPGTGTNPEELFALGWAACFQSALHTLAKIRKIEVADSSVTCEVSLMVDDKASVSLAARMLVTIPGMDDEAALALVHDTHKVCPYSKATAGNIPVDFVIE